jgi:hypothetical protein
MTSQPLQVELYPEMDAAAIRVKLFEQWKLLSDDEKAPYLSKAAPSPTPTSLTSAPALEAAVSGTTLTAAPPLPAENSDETPKKSVAELMMEKMGYKEGSGLGKDAQGIVAPVVASNQLGLHGLGFQVEGLERGRVFDQKIENVVIKQVPVFIAPCPGEPHELDSYAGWMKEGPYALDMTQHVLFCEPEIVNELCAAKTLLDTIPDRDFRNAR